ncbi:MAG: adenine phosphoribosyltransferase [Planctomycetota bacterium]|jgi:adenine phosphoribosyltransferase
MDLTEYIRDIQDWPKDGVLFKDITPLLNTPKALSMSIELMASPFRDQRIDVVAGAESRGFIFGVALARALNAGFVPIRKPNKLPYTTHAVQYGLEYGTDELHIHTDAIQPGSRVLLADDLLATGGTMAACCELVEKLGADLVGVSCLIELAFLPGRAAIEPHDENFHAVITYE